MRATFISADGSREERVSRCGVQYSDGVPHVYVLEADVPDWVSRGDEIVVGIEDGSVECAIGQIGSVWRRNTGAVTRCYDGSPTPPEIVKDGPTKVFKPVGGRYTA